MAQALYDIITGINKQIKSICCKINILETALENCGGGGNCTQFTIDFNTNLDTLAFPFNQYGFYLGGAGCNSTSDYSRFDLQIANTTPITSIEELIASLNQSASIFGEFSVYNNGSNNQLRLLTSCCLSSDLSTCGGSIERGFYI